MVDFILLTPTLSNRRGSLITLQSIVFVVLKSCVDAYALTEDIQMADFVYFLMTHVHGVLFYVGPCFGKKRPYFAHC